MMARKFRIPMTGSLYPDWEPSFQRTPGKGHAAAPGGGPRGETCGTCDHIVRHTLAKTYLKCGLIRWTNGSATDIRAGDPACVRWEPKKASGHGT